MDSGSGASVVGKGAILAIGNPLLDVSATVPADLLEKYELKPANACLAEPKHLPLYEELVKEFPVEYIAGGDAQNSVRAAQWMLSDVAPTGATRYIGCIGKDHFGEQLRAKATADGLDVHYLVDESTPTGSCAVLITNKDRSLVANLSAAEKYKKSHLDENMHLVEEARLLYGTGFFLTVSPESLIAFGEHAVAKNKPYLFNLSAPFLMEFFWDKMSAVLEYVDVLFANEHEAAALGKRLELGEGADIKEIAKKAAALPKKNTQRPRTVIFTQGANQVIVATDSEVAAYPTPRVPDEEIVDLNGAGDCFVGGFLSQYVQERPIHECIKAGHYCAGVCIRTSGIKFTGKPSYTSQ
jgi:adenosine kinase